MESQATEDRDPRSARRLSQHDLIAEIARLQASLDRDGILQTGREYAYLATACVVRGNIEQAKSVLRRAMPNHSRNPAVLRTLGELEFQSGDYAASADLWRALLAKKKENAGPAAYSRLASSLRRLGSLGEALEVVGEGRRHFPENAAVSAEHALLDRMIAETRDDGAVEIHQVGRHPYKCRPTHNFWDRTVSSRNSLEIDGWYKKKFNLTGRSIASGGSCFAQHLGRRLRQSGFDYLDVELAPDFLLPESHADFGYGLFSARYGNIYTSRQLVQLVERTLGRFTPRDRAWKRDEGVVDPFRPTIEPDPYGSEAEMLAAQRNHLQAVEELLRKTDVFVFTLGLTECWTDAHDGAAYPIAPGVSGGLYDPGRHRLINLGHADVLEDLHRFMELARGLNPTMRLLMTVSPVPLMATATDQNVVVASTYSKSVLRAAAGSMADAHDWADYFPSFEIINSHVMRGQFYDPDMRNVSPVGVDHVMRQFFSEHLPKKRKRPQKQLPADADQTVCDEELLGAFGV